MTCNSGERRLESPALQLKIFRSPQAGLCSILPTLSLKLLSAKSESGQIQTATAQQLTNLLFTLVKFFNSP